MLLGLVLIFANYGLLKLAIHTHAHNKKNSLGAPLCVCNRILINS